MTDNVKKIVPATLKPDPDVVSALERMLDRARSGEVRDIVMAATLSENRYQTAVHTSDLVTSMGLLYAALHTAAAIGKDGGEEGI